MNKTTMTTAVGLAVGIAATLHYRHSVKLIMSRFPLLLDDDYNLASRAYRIMILRALKGEYNLTAADDKTNDTIFISIVQELRSK